MSNNNNAQYHHTHAPPPLAVGPVGLIMGPPPQHTHLHRHVCMLEGDSFDPTYTELDNADLRKDVTKAHEEIQRLRDLLSVNNISSEKPLKFSSAPKVKPFKPRTRILRSSTGNTITKLLDDVPMPFLPNEVILRILRYGVTSPIPIVDPFFKFRKGNATKEEASSTKHLTINFLATCKAFHREGVRYLVLHNEFVFTQAAALIKFSRIPVRLRSTLEHVTLRVVGQYYDDEPRKADMSGSTDVYHPNLFELKIPILARPAGLFQDKGVQSHTWTQLSDFLKAMKIKVTPSPRPVYEDLFPALKKLRVDLVNFCEHLPFPGPRYASVVRWYGGHLCEELFLTGAPDMGHENSEEYMLRHLLVDEGLFGASYPVFVSNHNGTFLKSLADTNFHLEVIRANKDRAAQDRPAETPATKKKSCKKAARIEPHPLGGFPPVSKYRAERTIWKWTSTRFKDPKRWIEFSRKTGMMAEYHDDHEIDSDFEEDTDSDSLDGAEFDFLFGEGEFPPLVDA